MGRTARAPRQIEEPAANEVALTTAADARASLATQAGQVMQAIGYELSYDRERVIQEATFYMAQSAEAMLETGKRLIVLKEHEPHGEFLHIVQDRLQMSPRTAQVMMQAAVKYLDPRITSKAQAPALLALGKTKLLELMTEDLDDISSLAEGGTIAGLELDDIERMSSRELRQALRDARDESDAKDKVLADKNAAADKLRQQLQRVKKLPPDDVLQQLLKETAACLYDARGALNGGLRQAFVALRQHHEQHGGDSLVTMAGMVGQLQADLAAVRDEFGLPDVAGDAVPEWLQQGGK
jgi:hypothetical protein